MNTHDFIQNFHSFISFIYSFRVKKNTYLSTCKQIYGLVLIETYIVTNVYKKIKTSFPHHTVRLQKCCQQKLLLTAL